MAVKPKPKAREASEAERTLVHGLASYLKETTIYPDTNVRVRQKLDELVAAAAAVSQGNDQIRVRITPDGFGIGHSLIENDSPMHEWLTERLTSTAIGAIDSGR